MEVIYDAPKSVEERAQDKSANRAVLSPLRATFRLPFRKAGLLLPPSSGNLHRLYGTKAEKGSGHFDGLAGWIVGKA